MRAILLRLLLVFGLPFLLSGCKVVVWGYTNNSLGPQGYSRTRVGFGSTRRGLTLRIHVATSRHRALQASLNRAARAAEAARQQAAELAEARAEQTRQAILEEAAKATQEEAETEDGGKTQKYPS